MSLLNTLHFGLWALWQQRARRMSPERLRRLQDRRLRRLLHHAARAPFFAERFRGRDLARCPLAELPVTNKVELMAEFDRAVTDPEVRLDDVERFLARPENARRLYRGKYAVCHTSGSQGARMVILHDRLSLELTFALQMTRGNALSRPGPREALRRLVSPARIATVATFIEGFYPSACAWEHMPAGPKAFVRVLRLAASDPRLVEKLNEFRPTALTAYVSVLEALAVHADRLRLAPDLRQVTSSSETLSERSRRRFEAAFGAPVMDNYAMGECFFLSNGCPTDGGVHVNADWAVLEVVDERYRPVPPGQLGHKVLVTNLASLHQPFIRYEIGDRVVAAAGPCRCGSALPRLERIEGRTAEFFWVRAGGEDRQLLGLVFKNALELVPEVREWQAVQQGPDRILLRLEMLPGRPLDRAAVLRQLRGQLAPLGFDGCLQLEVEQVARLAPDPSTGKIRRTLSHAEAPEPAGALVS